MSERPIQYAAGTLAASGFIAVTQILAGAALDIPLYVALIAFAINIPLQIVVFFAPVAGATEPVMSWPQIVYWAMHRYSTIGIMIGFAALFYHFAWWIGLIFGVSSIAAYCAFRYLALSPRSHYDPPQA